MSVRRSGEIADDVEERCPDTVVVCPGILRDYIRGDRADQVVGARHGAIQQQKPCGLQVWYLLEPLPEP